MVLAGIKVKRFSLPVNHNTKAIHHHHHRNNIYSVVYVFIVFSSFNAPKMSLPVELWNLKKRSLEGFHAFKSAKAFIGAVSKKVKGDYGYKFAIITLMKFFNFT